MQCNIRNFAEEEASCGGSLNLQATEQKHALTVVNLSGTCAPTGITKIMHGGMCTSEFALCSVSRNTRQQDGVSASSTTIAIVNLWMQHEPITLSG